MVRYDDEFFRLVQRWPFDPLSFIEYTSFSTKFNPPESTSKFLECFLLKHSNKEWQFSEFSILLDYRLGYRLLDFLIETKQVASFYIDSVKRTFGSGNNIISNITVCYLFSASYLDWIKLFCNIVGFNCRELFMVGGKIVKHFLESVDMDLKKYFSSIKFLYEHYYDSADETKQFLDVKVICKHIFDFNRHFDLKDSPIFPVIDRFCKNGKRIVFRFLLSTKKLMDLLLFDNMHVSYMIRDCTFLRPNDECYSVYTLALRNAVHFYNELEMLELLPYGTLCEGYVVSSVCDWKKFILQNKEIFPFDLTCDIKESLIDLDIW